MTIEPEKQRPIRIANCSGFYGDRLSAAREMVEGGPIDVLTGDWLAELTMLILAKTAKRGGPGYARTFVTQMEQVLATCLERGIKVVANAGGLDPAGCAQAVRDVAKKLGLAVNVAHVEGDNLIDRVDGMRAEGIAFTNLDTGEAFGDRAPMTANAYLGGWGIAQALSNGADVVVTGRVTDAAVVVGPAMWWHGWQRTDWDALAGAVVAGHVIECGAQATGGNYSFFTEVSGLEHPGFPLAEVHANGDSVITKHAGTGGMVDVGTVTAQLLYEIGGPRYANPDVVTRFDTINLSQEGPDRVRISGTKGEPAPPTVKVAMNFDGGYRNGFTFCLTGLNIEEKAALIERTMWSHIDGGRESFADSRVQLIRTDKADPQSNEEAVALLKITVKDPDERKVGRRFANVGVEMALGSYPGMFGLGGPSAAEPYGVYWPALIPRTLIHERVVLHDGTVSAVDSTIDLAGGHTVAEVPASGSAASESQVDLTDEPTTRVPFGRLFGARSGDKGGNANVGVWARNDEAWAWLNSFLTVDRFRELISEARVLPVECHEFKNIRALNFVVVGLLEEGVASSTRQDAQAKGLGEYLRAKMVDVPTRLLP
jgi:hypothetical protein